MGETVLERSIRDRQRSVRRAVGEEIGRIRLEAGLSMRELGAAIGIDPGHLSRVEAGDRDVSVRTLVAVAAACGHDASIKCFPSSGPRVRDRHQVRMLEALLREAHPRWQAQLEVPVYRPVRGVIDIVLVDRETDNLVAGEGHSALSAVDAQVRWARQKVDALPSAIGWPWSSSPMPSRTMRLLVLRDTQAMRALVQAVPATFASAYPAGYEDAIDALTGSGRPWPGDALLWVRIEGARTHLLPRSPLQRS
ncbi:MAG TPA: helix-turn-helix transcriptional regulator [Candidatus Limnocylindrales bacterium]